MTAQYPPPYGPPDHGQWRNFAPTPPAPKKHRKWPWVVAGGVVLLFVIIGTVGGKSEPAPIVPTQPAGSTVASCAAAGCATMPNVVGKSRDDAMSDLDAAGFVGKRDQYAQVVTDAVVIAQDPQPGGLADKAGSVSLTFHADSGPVFVNQSAPAQFGPQTSFGDGTWVVGEDIVAGTYKTEGAKEGLFEYCQITTHSDENAESPLLDWKNGNAHEPIRVKISGKVKSVKATGCEDFVKVG